MGSEWVPEELAGGTSKGFTNQDNAARSAPTTKIRRTAKRAKDWTGTMAVGNCGWCGTRAHMRETAKGSAGSYGPRHFTDLVVVCDECKGSSVERKTWLRTDGSAGIPPASSLTEVTFAPTYVHGQDFPDVPGHIAAAASEAHKSSSIGNRMSAILMARTVIEATAKDKGILKGTLQAKIEAMQAQSLVRAHIKESADEIRHFGNDMAHGDITEPVDDDDVTEVLALMDEVLNEVYQSHARLAKVREKRLAKKAADAS